MYRLRLWLNRHLQNGIWGYVLILVASLVVLACAVALASLIDSSSIYYNISYAIGVNPVDDHESHPHQWLFMLLGICGALVFGGLLVTVFTSGVERYVERVKEGQVHYHRLRGHVVIIGWNATTVSLISQVCRKHPRSKVVLLAAAPPMSVRAELMTSLPPRDERRVVIYASGDQGIHAQLEHLGLNHAREVFLTLEEDEKAPHQMAQLPLLDPISQLAGRQGSRSADPLRINVMVNDVESYCTLQQIGIPKNYYCDATMRQSMDIRLFNFYENWARLLWGHGGNSLYDQLDFEPLERNDKHVHLVIAGFGDMGQALLLEALRICHYPNPQRTRITVIDPNAAELESRLHTQHPYLGSIDDIEIDFIGDTVESPRVRGDLSAWACDERKLLTIALAMPEPDEALRAALSLPESVYYQQKLTETAPLGGNRHRLVKNGARTRVLVRQAVELSPAAIVPADRFPHLRIFGTLPEGINTDLLSDELPVTINGLYWDNLLGQAGHTDDQQERWRNLWFDIEKTSESSKYASRYQADRFRSLISILRRNDIASDPELMELLAASEHRRWTAERTLVGWRPTKEGEHRVDALKIHDCLIPYASLSNQEQQKDRNVILFANSMIR